MSEQDNNLDGIDNKSRLMAQLQSNAGNIFFVIVLGVATFFGWQYFTQNKITKVDLVAADKYIELQAVNEAIKSTKQQFMLTDNESGDEANTNEVPTNQIKQFNTNSLALVNEHSNTVYAWKVLMLKARNESDRDQFAEAVLTLESAINVNIDDLGLKAITQLRYAQALLANNEAEKALTAINSHDMPLSFEPSKQELVGDIKIVLNDMEGATSAYESAWNLLVKRKENRAMLALKMESLGMKFTPIAVDM